MNAIMSISFHTQKHADVLNCIDAAKKLHPTMTRSAIVRALVTEGARVRHMKEILDEYQEMLNKAREPHSDRFSWRKDLEQSIRRSL